MFGHFNSAFKKTIGHEGGYVNDETDRGGETKYGVTKRDYPQLDIKNLTLKQAKEIYKANYYHKSFDKLSEAIAIELFDTSVNMGALTARKMLQQALNLMNRNQLNYDDLIVDGLIGDKTLQAYKKVNSRILLKVLNGLQFARYVYIAENDTTQERFFNGWITRT